MSEIVTDFTAAEVLEALQDHLENGDGWGEWTTWDSLAPQGQQSKPLKITLRGDEYEVTWVESGGGMDQGSNAFEVFKVGSQFFRKRGYYASHYGYDWDGDFREVHAVEKTVTVWK